MLREPKLCGVGAILGGAGALAACAVTQPTGPAVMALPSQGKSLAVFRQEDGHCRNYASARTGGGTAVGATNAVAGQYGLQQRYDIAYTQCMYSYGDTVEAPPATYQPYASLYPYWPTGYGWYGPGFFGGDIFVFRGSNHFHNFHHFHHW